MKYKNNKDNHNNNIINIKIVNMMLANGSKVNNRMY
jgi:hypothetical protein